MNKKYIMLFVIIIYVFCNCSLTKTENKHLLVSYLKWDKESVELLYETVKEYFSEYDMVKLNTKTGEKQYYDNMEVYSGNTTIVVDPIDSELLELGCYYFQRSPDSIMYWGVNIMDSYIFRYSRKLKTKESYPITCYYEMAVNWSNEHIFLINDYDRASIFSVGGGIYRTFIKGDTILDDYEISSFDRTDFVNYNGKAGWMVNLHYVYLPTTILEMGILFVPDDTTSMVMLKNKIGVFSDDCSFRAVYESTDGILNLNIYDKEDSIVRQETP